MVDNFDKFNPIYMMAFSGARGKQPRWLVAELEKGAKLDDFLI